MNTLSRREFLALAGAFGGRAGGRLCRDGRRRLDQVGERANRLLVQSPRPIHRGGTRAHRPLPKPISRIVGQADRRRQGLRRGGAEVQRRAHRHRRARRRCAGRHLVVPLRAQRCHRPARRSLSPSRFGHNGLRRHAAGRLRVRRPPLRGALCALDAVVLLQQSGVGTRRPARPRTAELAGVRRMGSAVAARRRRRTMGTRLGQRRVDFLDVRRPELGVRRRLLGQVAVDVHRPGDHRGRKLHAGFHPSQAVTPPSPTTSPTSSPPASWPRRWHRRVP